MSSKETNRIEEFGRRMPFLEHLDEFRKRLVNSLIIIGIAFIFCWFVSDKIYNFLAIPVQRALAEAQSRAVPTENLKGSSNEKILHLNQLKSGDSGRYVFERDINLGGIVIPTGATVHSKVAKDSRGKKGLFSDEPIFIGGAVIPKGIRLPVDFAIKDAKSSSTNERMIVTTAIEPFTLYVTVSLYAAIALSVPFLLLQIWGFISPALYRHERRYATPFIFLSTASFIIGAAFAYYILFPPAVKYLLGLGADFQLLLRATDYFDFIILIMLAMGVIFQMPAVTYVLSRIGLISAGLLIRSWKIALVIILIAAALISPTGDIPNMMLFATPMVALYAVSIFVAWFFGKKRTSETLED